MFPFVSLVPMLLQTFLSLLTDWIFWLIVLLVAMQYRRMARTSQYLFDLPEASVWQPVLMATLFGIIGGFLGSFLLVLVGISVLEVGIKYLWLAAVLLMLIQQRFLCFAYAGGVLSLSYLLFGFPKVSVPQIMGLVAILHMVESLLILLSGHLEPLPVYVRTKQGRVVGGFNLQKFWPLPLVALLAWVIPEQEFVKGAVTMPNWWPLIKPELLQDSGEPLYMMMPVVAALGYGDIALTAHPEDKTRVASLELALYSIILLFLAVAASHFPWASFIPALFGPLGHEYIIHLGQRREMKGEPVFVPPGRGVMVLFVLHGSVVEKAGLRRGDIILSLNGVPIDSKYHLHDIPLQEGGPVEIEYLSGRRKEWRRRLLRLKPGETMGFVPVPEGPETSYLEVSGSVSLARRWWNRLKGKLNSRK